MICDDDDVHICDMGECEDSESDEWPDGWWVEVANED